MKVDKNYEELLLLLWLKPKGTPDARLIPLHHH